MWYFKSRVADILGNGHFKKYSEWGPFLVCFYVRWFVGFFPPIAVFDLYEGTGTKHTSFFVTENEMK